MLPMFVPKNTLVKRKSHAHAQTNPREEICIIAQPNKSQRTPLPPLPSPGRRCLEHMASQYQNRTETQSGRKHGDWSVGSQHSLPQILLRKYNFIVI